MRKEIKILNKKFYPSKKLFIIAGPCVMESEDMVIKHFLYLKNLMENLNLPFIFKCSYDKANRMSLKSFRGVGLEEGVRIFSKIKSKFPSIPILTDVHCVKEVEVVSKVVDVIQIPAFLCRQTDLVIEVAKTKKPINIKKGQFLDPYSMKYIIEKIESVGNKNIFLTERGTTFGYNNLVVDMRSISIMGSFDYPVIFDAGHSVQLPGKNAGSSSGMSEMIPVLARSAVAAGCDGVFFEVHENPKVALSDSQSMLKLSNLKSLLETLIKIHKIVNK